MGSNIQVAFMLPAEVLEEVDGLIPGQYRSRADVLRRAVEGFLDARRRMAIDAALERGYQAVPEGQPEAAWAELSVEGLAGADLDW